MPSQLFGGPCHHKCQEKCAGEEGLRARMASLPGDMRSRSHARRPSSLDTHVRVALARPSSTRVAPHGRRGALHFVRVGAHVPGPAGSLMGPGLATRCLSTDDYKRATYAISSSISPKQAST
jgi:hypothetical protein